MAKIRDFAVTEYGTATTASLVCNMPVHQANDLLLYFASKDGTPVVNDPAAGWTSLQDGVSAGAAYRCGWKVAASAAEALTLTTPTTENWNVVVVSIEGAPTSTPIAASAESAGDDTAMPFDGPSSNTGAETNCLILHAWFTDSGLSPTAYPPLVNLHAGDNGANSTAVAYTFQKAAGAVAAASWFGRGNDDGRGVVVAVKDGSSGASVPRYSDPAVSAATHLRPLVGLGTMFGDSWPTSVQLTAIGADFTDAYTDVGPGVFTSILTALNNPTAADVTFPTAGTDFVYFGFDSPWQILMLNVSTAGVTGTIAWEYYTGAVWSSTGMPTNNLAATGWQRLDFGAAIKAAMAQVSVNSVTKYWVRANIGTAYTTAVIVSQGRANGHPAAYIVASAAGDGGTNPYTDACQNAGASSTTTLNGPEILFGAALDMDTGIILGTIRPVLARDFAVDIGLPVNYAGGVQVTLMDTNLNYASYKIGARGCKNLDLDGRSVWAIDWNGSAAPWATRGSVNKSAVTRAYLSTLGQFGAAAVQWSMLNLVTRIGVAGGTAALPLNLDDIAYVANNCVGLFPHIQQSGAAVLIWAPLQFGGGDPVAISCDLNTFQFPTRYDGQNNFGWNAAEDVAGVKFYPKSGDSIKITNSVFTSPSRYRWEWDASTAANATIDFTGCTVINANVTLRDLNTAFANMAFINCPVFTQNGAEIEDCSFTNTKIAASSPANAAKIKRCAFTKTTGTQHAIEISGSAADFSLEGCQFSGYAASDGSTGNEAIYVNIGSGTMQISITGGGSTPSIRTAGATVTVVNARNLTITPIVTGSDIVIYEAGTTTVIESSQDLAGTSYVYDYPASEAGNSIDIGIFKAGYVPFYIRAYTKSNADASVPISQVVDRFYLA
jgi:hypothetical protein